MYPVTELFQEKIKEVNRLVKMEIRIQHAVGSLVLTDKDLSLGSLNFSEYSQPGEDFTVGGATASSLSLSIFNKEEYDNIDFTDAVIRPYFSLLVKEGADAHFIQPSQPSKMLDFDDEWETVPLGVFNVDKPNRQINTIELKAVDNMLKFELPYSLSKLSYPATLYQIYVNACNVCDVQIGTVKFPNMNHVVKEKPKGDLSFRDIVRAVAELSGTFAKCNRLGALELKWYKPIGLILGPEHRADLKTGDGELQIKGVMATIGDETYLVGTDEYTVDLSENPLLQGNYLSVLNAVFDNIKDTIFMPYSSDWQGNPALQAGDIITQVDRLGRVYTTLVTGSTFKYRGKSTLHAKGLPIISKRYKGSNGKLIASIVQKVDAEIGDQLSSLEQAQLNATELMANMLGGYLIEDKPNGITYIANNPDITKATEYWKWGLGGFAHYKNGVLDTSITADGSIVAMLVSANIITANMIQTGILSSKNNSLTFNLDTGTFAFNKGVVQFTENGLRISHGSSNQYTDINFNGVKRQWSFGESEYLTDIWIYQGIYSGWQPTSPQMIRIDLPARFRGRSGKLKFLIIPTQLNYDGLGRYQEYLRTIATIMKVENIVINNSEAYVWISAFIMTNHGLDAGGDRTNYKGLDFDLMVVGY